MALRQIQTPDFGTKIANSGPAPGQGQKMPRSNHTLPYTTGRARDPPQPGLLAAAPAKPAPRAGLHRQYPGAVAAQLAGQRRSPGPGVADAGAEGQWVGGVVEGVGLKGALVVGEPGRCRNMNAANELAGYHVPVRLRGRASPQCGDSLHLANPSWTVHKASRGGSLCPPGYFSNAGRRLRRAPCPRRGRNMNPANELAGYHVPVRLRGRASPHCGDGVHLGERSGTSHKANDPSQ